GDTLAQKIRESAATPVATATPGLLLKSPEFQKIMGQGAYMQAMRQPEQAEPAEAERIRYSLGFNHGPSELLREVEALAHRFQDRLDDPELRAERRLLSWLNAHGIHTASKISYTDDDGAFGV